MPKLKIKFLGTCLEYKGSKAFLRAELPWLLEMVTASHNTGLKERLFGLLAELERSHNDMDEHMRTLSRLEKEVTAAITKFYTDLDSARDGILGATNQDELLNATKQMEETQMSFNLQYLQLQSQMQHENRSYTAVSNIMKTKHDTVKNSIANIR